MHPNVYLRTFWSTEIRPEIFVAMSLADEYEERFQQIIRPAIEEIRRGNVALRANRVDLSKSGDSILSSIMDGVAHSEMVLADVSTIGRDVKTGTPFRNGNVMYELGLALACRQPSEVLVIRDDHDRFLFDVSTIPHKRLDFTDSERAKTELKEEMVSRLKERDHLQDVRLELAVATLTGQERQILEALSEYGPEQVFLLTGTNLATLAGVPRLLDKQLMVTVGVREDGQAMFRWTHLGYELASNLDSQVPKMSIPEPQEDSAA